MKDEDVFALAPRPAVIRAASSQTIPESLYKGMIDLFSKDL